MSKKTESIEVRLSPELKQSLNELGTQRGQAMSSIVRSLVEQEIAGSTSFSPQQKGQKPMPQFFKIPQTSFKSGVLALSTLIALGIGLNTMTINVAAANEDVTHLFEEADTDGNGVVTTDEFNVFFEEDIADAADDAMDLEDIKVPLACEADLAIIRNHDWSLDVQQEAVEFFAEMDQNKDGKLDLQEVVTNFETSARSEFYALDTDKNGVVRLSEFLTIAKTDTLPKALSEKVSSRCQQAIAAEEEFFLAEEFAELDENEDFVLSLVEYQAAL